MINILLEDFAEHNEWDESAIKAFIDVCNRNGYCSDSLISMIVKSDLEIPLCASITNSLFENKNFKQFIIGTTLYDLKFTYEKGIPLSFYLSVYTDSNKKVWELMKDTNEFLLDIYNTNSFENLTIEQLFIYNAWDQKIELIKAVLEKCENDDQRANYILNMRVLKSIDDSDSFQKYMCTNECLNLMMVKGVAKKVKELLWDDHPAIKAALTRWLNKNNISLVA